MSVELQRECEIDFYLCPINGTVTGVRLTHLSGISTQCNTFRCPTKNKKQALKEMIKLLDTQSNVN